MHNWVEISKVNFSLSIQLNKIESEVKKNIFSILWIQNLNTT